MSKPKPVAIYDTTDNEILVNLCESETQCAKWLNLRTSSIKSAVDRKSIVKGKYRIMYVRK